MLPPETKLEVRSRLPARRNGKPPLLFVHGGYCDSWCWEPYFLPWFAERGYAAHALSLRGHGASGGRESLFVAGLDDYVADVERVAASLPSPPILIGHSMGAAIVERVMATRPLRAAALIAPIPPGGLATCREPAIGVAARVPGQHAALRRASPRWRHARRAATDVLQQRRRIRKSLLEAAMHLTIESARALMDLTLRLHDGRPVAATSVFVLGASEDRISTPRDVRATATMYGVKATIIPGLAHMMMLEREWKSAGQPLLDWLGTLKGM